jgi:hypothetical protein
MPKKTRINKEIADELRKALTYNGYKEPQLSMLMAQAALETDGFNQAKAIANNNLGGIKYQTTFRGTGRPNGSYKAPSKEDKVTKEYAHFESIDDFVKKWIPFAHLKEMKFENKVGPPLEATNIEDYAHRVTLNHYHQKTEAEYLQLLKVWNNVLRSEMADNGSPPTSSHDIGNTAKSQLQNLFATFRTLQDRYSAIDRYPLNGRMEERTSLKQKLENVFFPKPAVISFPSLFNEKTGTGNNNSQPGEHKRVSPNSGPDRVVHINCNSPMIGNFCITHEVAVEDGDSLQKKLEETLLEILDSR